MTTKLSDPLAENKLQDYITAAAKAAGYEGFGMKDCDLSKPIWWAAYCRQSLDQQTKNNRLPEYRLTLAKMARDQGIVVPLVHKRLGLEVLKSFRRHWEQGQLPDKKYLKDNRLYHHRRVTWMEHWEENRLVPEKDPAYIFLEINESLDFVDRWTVFAGLWFEIIDPLITKEEKERQ